MFKICGCDRRAQYTRTQTNSVVKERYHEESTWETVEDLAETAVGVVDDFWAAHPELDRCRPREVPGEHCCPWCCEPKPKVRQQTKLEKAARLLPAGPVLSGKGSIFGTAAGSSGTRRGALGSRGAGRGRAARRRWRERRGRRRRRCRR